MLTRAVWSVPVNRELALETVNMEQYFITSHHKNLVTGALTDVHISAE